jgi:hypothetical protein
MRRISSLPVLEFCAMSDKLGENVASVNAARSTCFHEFCQTGRWPEATNNLPESDREEIFKWKKPTPLIYKHENITYKLEYKDAIKEMVVALDKDFNFVDIDPLVPQKDIAAKYPSAVVVGHLDMAWYLPALKLVVISDIKSSIFAVKARCKSLQLHGYGIALAKKLGATQYITGIWDASDGRHYVDSEPVQLESWDCEEYKGRITSAAKNTGDEYTTGTHCGGCWKRDVCSAHLVDAGDDDQFKVLLGGGGTDKDIRNALVVSKQLEDRAKKLKDICKSYVERKGPVRSEDGKKEWTVALRSGKKSLDVDALEADVGSLEKYMKKGNDFPVYDWRNVKE